MAYKEGDLKADLLAKAKAYCDATGQALSSVGKTILNDPAFFRRLEEGSGFTVATYEKAMCWLEDNMPKRKSNA